MCEHGSIPFSLSSRLVGLSVFRSFCFDVPSELVYDSRHPQGADSAVAEMIGTWFFNGFNSTDAAEYILDMSMFFANRAVLNKAVQLSSVDARPIYTSPGLQLIKPHKTLVGTIVVSALIAIQLVGLGLLVWHIYSVPAWTTSLDALAMARIGREVLEGEIPPLGPVSKKDVKKMREVDALIGLRDVRGVSVTGLGDLEELGYAQRRSEADPTLMKDKEAVSWDTQLTLGGRGIIR
jgi:hypothetical protein